MAKRKILIFSDWYKPGYKAGGPIQSISNLINLLGQKYDFYIITRNTDYQEVAPYQGLKSNEWITGEQETIYYLSSSQQRILKVYSLIKELSPDLIYLNSLYSIYYTILPMLVANWLRIKVVLAVRGMLSEGSFNVKKNKKTLFLKLFKFFGFNKKLIFHATSENEVRSIKDKLGESCKIRLANNVPYLRTDREYSKSFSKLRITFIGRIAPEKNLLYAIHVMSKVNKELIFDIYGPIYNNSYWMKCKNEINNNNGKVVINYHGVLPHDLLHEKLKLYDVLFLPSTGENFGHIINEAMMNCCIPLISDQTPWRNLEECKAGFDLPLINQKGFVKKIEYLASLDNSELKKIALSAYDFARKKHDVSALETSYTLLFI